jgi:NADH-quinone oxidoreductase subunit G
VDNVLTTQELAHMIQSSGIMFDKLQPEAFDMPFGFFSGAGVIFGNSGGVTEAVLRFAAEKVTGKKLEKVEFQQVRGDSGSARSDDRGQRQQSSSWPWSTDCATRVSWPSR